MNPHDLNTDLDTATRTELNYIARSLGIPKYRRLRKQDLVAAIKAKAETDQHTVISRIVAHGRKWNRRYIAVAVTILGLIGSIITISLFRKGLHDQSLHNKTVATFSDGLKDFQNRIANMDFTPTEDALLFSEALQRKIIDRIHGTLIYISIGEETGLPIQAVAVPNGLIVYWKTEDGDLYFDPSDKDSGDREYFKAKFSISDQAIQAGAYLRDLKREELISLAHFNIARHMAFKELKHEDAVQAYQKVIEVCPSYPDVYFYLCHSLKALGKDKAALDAYKTGIDIAPNYSFHRL